MALFKGFTASLFGLVLASAAHASVDQNQIDAFAAKLGYGFAVLDNHTTTGGCLPAQACFTTEIRLTLPDTVPDGPWQLYVGMPAKLTAVANDDFDFLHGQGDMYRISPKPGRTLQAGTTYRIRELGLGHFDSPYFALPNAYVSVDGFRPAIVAATKPVIDSETGQEELPFVAPFTDEAQLAHTSARDQTTWLTPEKAYQLNASRGLDTKAPEFGILPTPALIRHLPGPALDLGRGIALRQRR